MTSRRDLIAGAAAAGIAAAIGEPAGAQRKASPGGIAQTVLGRIDASQLGFTLPHEHVADSPYVLKRWPKAWGGRPELTARAVDVLKRVRAAGVDTIVDLGTYDVWRDIRFLEEVSRRSGLHMIAATGQRFFPPQTGVAMPARTLEGLSAFFTREIEWGIDGSSIKAGVIKIGIIAKRPTALEETGLRAAARTSKTTGAPLRIHTHAVDRAADNLVPILAEEGLSPARISFDHSDDSGDMDYFLGLVRRGYFLSMDHVHRGLNAEFKPSFERRTECIRLLTKAGFADRIFLSQDSELGGALLPQKAREWRETIDPAGGMLFTMRELIPRLRQIGVSARDIHVMTVKNPRRFFSLA